MRFQELVEWVHKKDLYKLQVRPKGAFAKFEVKMNPLSLGLEDVRELANDLTEALKIMSRDNQ